MVNLDGGVETAVGEDSSLGLSGGAGSIEQRGHIVGHGPGRAGLHFAAAFVGGRFPEFKELGESEGGGVVGVALDVVVDDNLTESGDPGNNLTGDFILGCGPGEEDCGAGVAEDIFHLLLGGGGVD